MSVAGDFKVTGINDPGTTVKFGADDLDKINKILNGEDLSLDILIDNEWSFKHNKLVIRDFTGDNKIRIGTSEEAADWSITIPTLGGNREPLFTDLAQDITEKTFNLSDNSLTDDLAVAGDLIMHDGTKFIKGIPKLDDLAEPDDNIDLDVSLLRHGLVPKAPNITGQFLRSDGIWAILPYATTSARGAVTLADDGESAATLAVQSNDLRLSNNRDPNNHAINHELGGGDQLTIDWTQLDGVPADFTPSTHALTHGNGGTDEIAIDWSQITSGIPTEFNPSAHTHSADDITSGILDVGVGGTGKDTITEHALLVGGALNVYDELGVGTDGQILTVVSGSPTWTAPDFSTLSLDDLGDVDVTTVTPVDNYVLTYISGEWVAAEPPGASGGEANTLTNVGAEIELVKPKVGVNYDIRTLEAGTNVSITQNVDTVTIAATDTNTITDALTDLTVDVLITTPADGEVLTYDSASSKWINAAGGSSSVAAFDDLTDVTITTPSDGQLVKYESASSLWKNISPNIEVVGVAKADGDNATTQFIIPHGATGASTSSYAFVDVASHAFNRTWSIDATNITVDLTAAPENGTDNVIIYFRVIP